jgi:hypothetical protein
MYKFIVSCYYWPAVEGPLRLRSIQIRSNRRKPGIGLADSQVARLSSVDNSSSSTERRTAARLKAGLDAELTASLSILDTDTQSRSESLIFFGRTIDLSSEGLSLILPSAPIDERYCNKVSRISLSLHLPRTSVNLQVSPVRCVPLDEEDTALGYLMGAKILSFERDKSEYEEFLRTISNLAVDN